MNKYFLGGLILCIVGGIYIFSGEQEATRGWEYFRDMAQTGDEEGGISYEAFDSNLSFKNEQAAQTPIPNTVPRGTDFPSQWKALGVPLYEEQNPSEVINQSGIYGLRAADISLADEHAEAASITLKNPLPPTAENIARGKNLHNTFCYPCHGLGGSELGPLASYTGFGAVQSLSTYPYAEGRFYYTITAGRNAMPTYATQISSQDRWRIVHYILYGLQKRSQGKSPSTAQQSETATATKPQTTIEESIR